MIERHRSIVAVRLAPTSLASDAPRSSDTSAITTLAPFWASLRTVAEPKPPARHIPRLPRRPCRTARRPTRPRAGAGPPPTAASPRSPAGAPAGRPAPAARRHGPAAPRSPAARTPAPPRRVPATAPRVPPSVRRPRATHTSTTTHPFRYSHFRRFWLRPALCGTTRGLRQAPGSLYTGSGKEWVLSFPLFVRCGRTTSSRSGGVRRYVGPGGSPMGLRMQPRSEKFFTLISKAGPNVVESAAILTEFVAAPHERWAELAKRMHDTEYAGDDTTKRS